MKNYQIFAIGAGVLLGIALLCSGVTIENWQFWLAGLAIGLAYFAGQSYGRSTPRVPRHDAVKAPAFRKTWDNPDGR
ncbi:hypothetical protein BamIOP4010DRAFT_0576 [Burkholderia ambifaria IOP40-10]|uniref:Uncharacterized protein n=1 Tax=Burkholderia ambifaria IOP40-10 TaxID=396596 RepID=B1F967_9BURK|nr:hypothetical protein [Burkholderia ambifaria]EDT05839.1 hypothetical protein BamIOP4010DRAFT_0576 [Burkholderia ambifaria IOP40-10]